MLTPEQQNDANVAKLKQLAQDAYTKQEEVQGGDKTYWIGYERGVLRALAVLEGRG